MIIQPNSHSYYLLYTLPHQKKKNLICARSGRLILSEGFKKKKKDIQHVARFKYFGGPLPKKGK